MESCEVWQQPRIELHVNIAKLIVDTEVEWKDFDLFLLNVDEGLNWILFDESLQLSKTIKITFPVYKCAFMYIIEPKIIPDELVQKHLTAIELQSVLPEEVFN